MKNLPYIISGIGFVIFGIAGSCDFVEYPIIAIPIIAGVLLMYVGYHIERSWSFEEKEDFECTDCADNDNDNNIARITYDNRGNERYTDFE